MDVGYTPEMLVHLSRRSSFLIEFAKRGLSVSAFAQDGLLGRLSTTQFAAVEAISCCIQIAEEMERLNRDVDAIDAAPPSEVSLRLA